jgi:hypothetical protein
MAISLQGAEARERERPGLSPAPINLTTFGEDYAGLQVPLWLFAFLLPPITLVLGRVVPWWLMLVALALVSVALISTLAKVTVWLRAPKRLQIFPDRLVVVEVGGEEIEITSSNILAARWQPGASRFLAICYGALALILSIPALLVFTRAASDEVLLKLICAGLVLMGFAAAAAASLLWRMGPSVELVLEPRHQEQEPLVIVVPATAEAALSRWLGPDAPAVASLVEPELLRAKFPRIDWVPWAAMLIPVIFSLIISFA